MKNLITTILLLVLTGSVAMAQAPDSIIFKNGNYIVGEVKTMDRNVLSIETDYSDDDFTIEWDGIKEIYTKTFFLITLSNGSRYNGNINSSGPGKLTISTDDGQTIEVNPEEIVIMDDIDQGFWSQVYASVDFGWDITKANNFRQYSMRSNLGYIAKRWQLDADYSLLKTQQDDVDDIHRTDGSLTYKYFLPHDWYPLVAVSLLSNSEQQLDLRTTAKLGMGKYVLHTNQLYWGFSAGANYNDEKYSGDLTADRSSWEGFLGTELNLFNIGDLSLLTQLTAYPSFTESGRWRSDFKFDMKYDLPLDFYVKLGYTLNYDNKPAEGSSKSDYVFHTGFGWEW
ncbi:DUF481 domain-containing protein [Maribellus sediminis]|uniref:DUF481 domain-containing protein n=1 Tax=Maribellus sediminis TaxID=2696285 RepID=UPI0014304C0E|nr:DUF481 domain-containing protein [Maribellus sediminis]